MTALVALLAGLLFGLGLLVSGMVNPANVIAFLDVTGQWRPALLYTMGAAVAVAAPAYAVARARGSTLRGQPVASANRSTIDRPLVCGSIIFGVGWGLSGICPGPGLLLLVGGSFKALVFVAALLVGILAVNAAPQDP